MTKTQRYLATVLAGALTAAAGNASTYAVSVFGEPVVKVHKERTAVGVDRQRVLKDYWRVSGELRREKDLGCVDALIKAQACFEQWKAEGAE